MKYKVLVIFLVFSCVTKLFSQENIIDLFLLGDKKYVEIYYNDEPNENIYNLVYTAHVNKIKNGFYRLEIDNTYFVDYYIFKIKNIINNGEIIDGQLVEIWHGDSEGNPYCDESGNELIYENGNIEINTKNNIITLKIAFFMFGSKYNNKIILKNSI